MRKISKRYKKLLDTNVNQEKFSSVEKIIDKVKANANAKFVESIDMLIYLMVMEKKLKLLFYVMKIN